MKKVILKFACLTLAISALLDASPVTAQTGASGPSFTCSLAPQGGVEEMICRDSALSRQDRVMATAFSHARAGVRGTEGLGELLSSQQAWLAERAACGNLRTQKSYCVEASTARRIGVLQHLASQNTRPDLAQARPHKTGTNASSRPPQGPSFSCTNARTNVERAICARQELSLQDWQVASLYRQLQRVIGNNPIHATFATEDQRSYIEKRNRCGRKSQTLSACLQVAHENRIKRLGELIGEINSRP